MNSHEHQEGLKSVLILDDFLMRPSSPSQSQDQELLGAGALRFSPQSPPFTDEKTETQ